MRQTTHYLRPVLKTVFRYRIDGLEKIGNENYLFVANHNAGAAVEILILLCEWTQRWADRPIFGLTHRFVFKNRLSQKLFTAIGSIPATKDSAEAVLRRGASLMVFPGGNWQALRPIWLDHNRSFGGRLGWARLAQSSHAKIIPVRIDGSHRCNPMFFRSRWLATLLVIPRLIGVTWFSVSLSQIIYSLFALQIATEANWPTRPLRLTRCVKCF